MLAHAPAAAALSVLRERATHPAANDPGPDAGRLPAGAWGGSGARALAPLLTNAVGAAPSSHPASSQGPKFPAPRAGAGDSLDLSALAQRLLEGLAGDAADGGSAIDGLLGGEVGGYLDAALERMTSEIENLFRLLGMSAADAATAAAGIGAPAAVQARAGMLTFHAGSSAMSASSLVTATGSRQSLSLVMQPVDIALDPANGTVTISQQSLSVAVEVRTGDQVQADPLILDLAGNGIALAAAGGRLFDLDGDGRLDRPAWVAGDDALLALDRDGNGSIDDGGELFGDQHGAADGFAELARFDANGDQAIDRADPVFARLRLLFADGRQAALDDRGIVRLRLGAVVPLGIDLVGGRLVTAGRFDRADGGVGGVADALLDLNA